VLLQLNTDFTARGLQSDEITSIVNAWQAGAISQETMFDLFRRGEVLPVGRTDEEEARLTRNAERGVRNGDR
jgi:cytochrome c peroxidase